MPGQNTTFHIDSYTTHLGQSCFAMCCTSMVSMERNQRKILPLLPPPKMPINKAYNQQANQQNNLSMKTNKCAKVKDVSNLITALDKYLHIPQNCIHSMLFSI